ncbi:MAG: hypothetical protein LBN38_04595 [Verrucomicrobiota bacterium]|jgi:hypothetical protein|nr:hypothetical protein [Verrucomicrobiota bacterium]
MRRILARSLFFCLFVVLVAGGVVTWRGVNLYRTAAGGFKHLRYLLESGETVEGAPADDVLSDSYLLSLFGNNPELVERLKTVVDLGLATDATLKLGSVSAMVVTYRQAEGASEIEDAAIYVIGGFPDPKSQRLGFHSSGHMSQKLNPTLWSSGNAIMNLLGRDIIVFCEQDKAEAHMALLFDLLNGRIMPLAERIADAPLHYTVVFPEPKEVVPPNLRNSLDAIMIKGKMSGDAGETELVCMSPNVRSSSQVSTILRDMASLARMTFHDHYGGYIKDMPWGKMNDTWWAVEYVELLDSLEIISDYPLVVARVAYDRLQNNVILKTIERAGRDLAAQKAFSLSSTLPWEFAFQERANPSSGYWSMEHQDGPEWPLGDEGIRTPGSIAAAAKRARLQAEKEAREQERREQQASPSANEPLPT